ncbi:MAG: hypothetical protein DMF64_18860 [Acidobacteria bacterium]|nr:MAG: hypothetical protein DMF64_18860 [Acidobacteriota bacterium]
MKPRVAFMNHSPLMKDADLARIVRALQIQVTRDFAPIWGVDAELLFNPKWAQAPPGAWQIVLLDTSDVADDLGYHDETDEGLPLGKVFVKSDLDAGSSVSATVSHELLEMLADPDVNGVHWIERPKGEPILYAVEVCDPVEADQYGYEIDGVLVSDFVTPAYFETFHKYNSVQFDFRRHLTRPLEILADGYMSVCSVRTGARWREVTSSFRDLPAERAGQRGSRRERRRNRSRFAGCEV